MKVYLIALLALLGSNLVAQHYIVLDDSTKLLVDIADNYPDSIFAASVEGSDYALIPKTRVVRMFQEKTDIPIYTLSGLDKAYEPKPFYSSGRLLDKGAGQMIGGIAVGLGTVALSSILAISTPNDATLEDVQGRARTAQLVSAAGGIVSLSLTISGLSKIRKAGRLIDAQRY